MRIYEFYEKRIFPFFLDRAMRRSRLPALEQREIALFFPDKEEISAWTPATEAWVYSAEEL